MVGQVQLEVWPPWVTKVAQPPKILLYQRKGGQTIDLKEHNAKECESIAGEFPSASPASEAIHFGKVPASRVSCGLSKLLAPQGHQKRAHSWVRVHTEPDPGSVHHAQPVFEADVALNA